MHNQRLFYFIKIKYYENFLYKLKFLYKFAYQNPKKSKL